MLDCNIGRMNLAHLKTFHNVVIHGSFTKAARILFLTQPAVSQQIHGLENALKVILFDRSSRKISLTNEGKVLFSYTQRLFTLFDEIEHVFQDLSHLQTGNLVLAASAFMATYYLPPLISHFNKLFPHVALSIQTGNSEKISALIINNEAEFGFSGRVSNQPHLHQIFIHREPYVVVVASGSPLARLKRPLSIDEFINTPFVMREKGARTRSKIDAWLKINAKHKQATIPAITASSLEVAKQLIANSCAITVLPYSAVVDDIANGVLSEVKVEHFDLNADYYLTYNAEKNLSKAALKFLKLLQEKIPVIFQSPDLLVLNEQIIKEDINN